jgi:hypothetical protein
MADTVRRGQRWTEERPCPICGGWDRMPRGRGTRCSGYVGHDGKYAHCSREELAGGMPQEAGGSYAHRLEGPCRCGATHGDAPTPVIPIQSRRERPMQDEGWREVARWEYEGGLVVVRAENAAGEKRFWQLHRGEGDKLERGAGDAPRTLYLAPQIRELDPRAFVWLVEGEKCADSLAAVGQLATTTPGGAAQWAGAAERAAELLRRRNVVILPDNDEPGRRYAAAARKTLERVCASLRVLELPGLGEGEDVADWLQRGGDPEDLVKMAETRADLAVRTVRIAAASARELWSRVLPPAIPTGLKGLDRVISGLRAEGFAVLNAPPGRGKTGLACQVARGISATRPTLLVSSELSERQALARVAAQVLQTPWLRLYDLGPSEAPTIERALQGLQLYVARPSRKVPILDLLNRTADDIGEVPIVVLDYLQHAARRLAKDDLRIAVGALSDDIGTWLTDHRSTGLVVSAVARGHYRADDDATAEDHLGAGKEAGEIEFDASVELFLRADLPPEGGSAPAKLHVTKHRFGASGQTVGLRFHGAIGDFTDDEAVTISELERECYFAVLDGARTIEDVRKKTKAGKPRVMNALRSLARRGLADGPPYRVLKELG